MCVFVEVAVSVSVIVDAGRVISLVLVVVAVIVFVLITVIYDVIAVGIADGVIVTGATDGQELEDDIVVEEVVFVVEEAVVVVRKVASFVAVTAYEQPELSLELEPPQLTKKEGTPVVAVIFWAVEVAQNEEAKIGLAVNARRQLSGLLWNNISIVSLQNVRGLYVPKPCVGG